MQFSTKLHYQTYNTDNFLCKWKIDEILSGNIVDFHVIKLTDFWSIKIVYHFELSLTEQYCTLIQIRRCPCLFGMIQYL